MIIIEPRAEKQMSENLLPSLTCVDNNKSSSGFYRIPVKILVIACDNQYNELQINIDSHRGAQMYAPKQALFHSNENRYSSQASWKRSGFYLF